MREECLISSFLLSIQSHVPSSSFPIKGHKTTNMGILKATTRRARVDPEERKRKTCQRTFAVITLLKQKQIIKNTVLFG